MSETRMRLGRIRGPLAPAPSLSSLLTPGYTLPPIPARKNWLAHITDWNILGNGPDPRVGPNFEGAGDCEAVRAFNDEHVVTLKLGKPTAYPPNMAHVWELYRTQNPDFDPRGSSDTNGPDSPADRGMNTQTLLEYLATHGMPGSGRKVAGWATVDLTNEAEVDAALALFGRLWLDVVVCQAQQTQFGRGKPWDYVATSPEEGGHAILGGGYSPDTRESMDAETWACVVKLTDKFRQHQVEQALIVIWEDELDDPAFLAGIDQAAAAAAFEQLTGKPYPQAA